jgi:Zn-finger nucleic acid-binding protein
MFAGTQFCPHCGTRTASGTADPNAAALPCPGCDTEMPGVRIGSTPMHQCPSCAGNWLDTETFTQLCTNREERGSVANLMGGSSPATIPAAPLAAVHYLSCPRCKKTMNRTNFGHRSGVIIDVCKGHGAWFDSGELRRVLLFVESGGLEKARAEDMRRQIEESMQLQRALHDANAATTSMAFYRGERETNAGDDSLLRRMLENLLL